MRTRKPVTKKEAELLEQLRGHDKDECIEIWNDVRERVKRRVPLGFWGKYNHRKYIVEAFVKEYQKNNSGEYPTAKEFYKNKLSGLISHYYECSPLKAFEEAGFTNRASKNYDLKLDEAPWLVLQVPMGYWENSINVKKAVDWLAKKTGKEVTRLESDDFKENDLRGLLNEAYEGSPIAVIRKAGYEIKELERDRVPQNYWTDENNRTNAIREFVSASQKPAKALMQKDFKNEGLAGLLFNYFRNKKGGHREALQEAGLLPENAGD